MANINHTPNGVQPHRSSPVRSERAFPLRDAEDEEKMNERETDELNKVHNFVPFSAPFQYSGGKTNGVSENGRLNVVIFTLAFAFVLRSAGIQLSAKHNK